MCAAQRRIKFRAMHGSLILNSPILQFFHYFDRLQISTVFLGCRFLIDR